MPDTIHGLVELDRVLGELPKKVARKELVRALKVGGKLIRDRAKVLVPVDSGFLKSQISMRKAPNRYSPDGAIVQIGVLSDIGNKGIKQGLARRSKRKVKHTGLVGFANSSAYYWRFVEFGTVKWPGKPFLVPAFEQEKYNADTAIKRELVIGVERQARALKR